jgi:hypothetical protein
MKVYISGKTYQAADYDVTVNSDFHKKGLENTIDKAAARDD